VTYYLSFSPLNTSVKSSSVVYGSYTVNKEDATILPNVSPNGSPEITSAVLCDNGNRKKTDGETQRSLCNQKIVASLAK